MCIKEEKTKNKIAPNYNYTQKVGSYFLLWIFLFSVCKVLYLNSNLFFAIFLYPLPRRQDGSGSSMAWRKATQHDISRRLVG